jgi:hypothetical protein
LNYTFTSPSVYLLIPTIFGTNSWGGRAGPSSTNAVFALNLDEVSTFVPDSGAVRQLTLNDLGTNCPQTAEQSALVTTIAGGPCDPILAAPTRLQAWASPCNACGRLGLFDPPYAIPTVTGSLVPVRTSSPAQSQPETRTTSLGGTPPSPQPETTSAEPILSTTAVPTTAVPITTEGKPTTSAEPVLSSTVGIGSTSIDPGSKTGASASSAPVATTTTSAPPTISTAAAARLEMTVARSLFSILLTSLISVFVAC